VCLRVDGYFGDDDPVNWPQPAFRGYEYLACVRTDDDATAKFWRKGFDENQLEEVSNHPGYFRVSQKLRATIDNRRAKLVDEIRVFRMSNSPSLHTHFTYLVSKLNDAHLSLFRSLETKVTFPGDTGVHRLLLPLHPSPFPWSNFHR
jgi:hypothetical protein